MLTHCLTSPHASWCLSSLSAAASRSQSLSRLPQPHSPVAAQPVHGFRCSVSLTLSPAHRSFTLSPSRRPLAAHSLSLLLASRRSACLTPLRPLPPLSALRSLPLFPSLCYAALPDGPDPPLFIRPV
ncbi:hypothetical protein FH972_001531 [Carpinus fangiana]|uniref:Uncharacterized protein n=1 Tax=Carpinus fangiana TaxID=176857 RepID=A0A5N6QC19_9ROSI|nr:hypothetical protein FH972_001531 [Carpinus fangiana]